MEISGYQTVTAAKMAELLGVSKSTLDKQRASSPQSGPPFVRLGRRVIYPLGGPHGYDAWLSSHVQGGNLGHE